MATFFEKKLARLRRERMDLPEFDLLKRATAARAGTIDEMTARTVGNLKAGGASPSAIIRANREGYEAVSKGNSADYQEAQATMQGRLDSNSRQIDQAEIGLEQERKQREARKNGLVKAGIQIGSAAVSLIPGVGPVAGAAIRGLGDVGSSFVGGGGKFGLDYANPDELMQGVSDTISGIGAASTLQSHKKTINEIGGFMTSPAYTNLSADDKQLFRNSLATGDMDIVNRVMLKFNGDQTIRDSADAGLEGLF